MANRQGPTSLSYEKIPKEMTCRVCIQGSEVWNRVQERRVVTEDGPGPSTLHGLQCFKGLLQSATHHCVAPLGSGEFALLAKWNDTVRRYLKWVWAEYSRFCARLLRRILRMADSVSSTPLSCSSSRRRVLEVQVVRLRR